MSVRKKDFFPPVGTERRAKEVHLNEGRRLETLGSVDGCESETAAPKLRVLEGRVAALKTRVTKIRKEMEGMGAQLAPSVLQSILPELAPLTGDRPSTYLRKQKEPAAVASRHLEVCLELGRLRVECLRLIPRMNKFAVRFHGHPPFGHEQDTEALRPNTLEEIAGMGLPPKTHELVVPIAEMSRFVAALDGALVQLRLLTRPPPKSVLPDADVTEFERRKA